MREDSFVPVKATGRAGDVIPLAGNTVAAGFPSPADDFIDQALDFNKMLVENPAATFAVRVAGQSMTGAGIFPNDIAIVNRARNPVNGSIVVAIVDGEFTLKRYRLKNGQITLQAENPAFPDIEITEGMDFEIWGVVTNSIRKL